MLFNLKDFIIVNEGPLGFFWDDFYGTSISAWGLQWLTHKIILFLLINKLIIIQFQYPYLYLKVLGQVTDEGQPFQEAAWEDHGSESMFWTQKVHEKG